MKSRLIILLITAWSLLVASSAFSATWYVRDGGDGSAPNASHAGAYDQLSSALAACARGDTIYVDDGSYGGVTLSTLASGTTLITIKKSTAGDHGTETGWNSTYGDGQAVFTSGWNWTSSYWSIDGVNGGGYGSYETGHGFRINMSSGQKNITLQANVSNVTLSHIDIPGNGRGTGLGGTEHNFYAAGGGNNNITLAYCYIHDVAGVQMLTRGGSGWLIEQSKFSRNGPASDGFHREAWSGTDEDNVTIRNNIFEDISNTAVIALVNGGIITAANWDVYGNVFVRTGAISDVHISALIEFKFGSPTFISGNNIKFHHNAVINQVGNNAGIVIDNGSGNEAYNNIWFNNTVNQISFGNFTHNYNWGYGNTRIEGCNPACNLDTGNPNATPFSNEANEQVGTSNPFAGWTTGNFALVGPTVAGVATLFTIDPSGATRGVDGTLDLGPFELNTGGFPSPPTAPSSLVATAVSTSQINLTWLDNSSTETSFVIARAAQLTAPFVDIATKAAGSTSHSDTGLAASSTYYYIVRAEGAGGASANSNTASATTQQEQAPPPDAGSVGGVSIGPLIGARRR